MIIIILLHWILLKKEDKYYLHKNLEEIYKIRYVGSNVKCEGAGRRVIYFINEAKDELGRGRPRIPFLRRAALDKSEWLGLQYTYFTSTSIINLI